MLTTNLRKVGGSVMLAVPPAVLDLLLLEPDAKVELTVQSGRLIVTPQRPAKYSLDQLLSECHPRASRALEEQEWLEGKPTGRELI